MRVPDNTRLTCIMTVVCSTIVLSLKTVILMYLAIWKRTGKQREGSLKPWLHVQFVAWMQQIACKLYSARRASGAKTIACNLLHAIACSCFRIWAGLSLSISVWLVMSYPKCRLTNSYCYYHMIPPNAVIGCNTLASWVFSNTFESLQLLHTTIAARCMQ